jgi:hypothetical protein
MSPVHNLFLEKLLFQPVLSKRSLTHRDIISSMLFRNVSMLSAMPPKILAKNELHCRKIKSATSVGLIWDSYDMN